MAGDIEKAKREMRWARSAADDRRWDQLEEKIQTIDTALQGVPDADKAQVLAELAPLRETLARGVREEKAGRIEREIQRNLNAAADQLNGGYRESPYLPKVIERLNSAEARDVLTAEVVSKLQSQIDALQAKSGGSPPPAPAARPAPAPAASAPLSDDARRISSDVERNLRFADEAIPRNLPEAESYIGRATSRLEGDDAKKSLPPDAMDRLRAEAARLKGRLEAARRQESSGKIEGEIQRMLGAAADQLASGYAESVHLARALERMSSEEARAVLSAEVLSKLQLQMDALKAKYGGGAAGAPKPAPATPPAPAAPAAPSSASSARAESPTAAAPPAAAAPLSDDARRISSEVERYLRFADDAIPRNLPEAESYIARAASRLDADDAKRQLPPDAMDRLRAETARLKGKLEATSRQEKTRKIEGELERLLRSAADEFSREGSGVASELERLRTRLGADDVREILPADALQRFRDQAAELQAKSEAFKAQKEVRQLEEYIGKFIRRAEEEVADQRKNAADDLRRAAERLDRDDVPKLLGPDSIARMRAEIARIEGLLSGANKKDAIGRVLPILKELEERVAGPIFAGSRAAWDVIRDLDIMKSKVRSPLSGIPGDDPDVKGIEARLTAVDAKIATATVKLGRDQVYSALAERWKLEQKEIAGWEEEASGDGPAATYQLPKTSTAVRRLIWFVTKDDHQQAGSEYKNDAPIQALLAEARKARDRAVEKLHGAYGALLSHLEKQPRPRNRFDLERPVHLASQAGRDFEGTPHRDANVARAKALGDRWQAEIEADRAGREAKYRELSAEASKAWPGILSAIKAQDGFDPLDSGSKGRTVLVKGLRNRIGWDFTGPYDFAIWVNGTPVAGNYDPAVAK
ncbi:MAG TPA: hypothetical protein VEN81_10480, partial [Planctomycetota bacterium]|nr:hypothetical protein [Planctomycetota bacterium]